MRKRAALLVALMLSALPALAETPLAPVKVTDWKAVYGRIETRDRIPARARIGGILTELTAAEGDLVQAGQQLALIVDDKIGFQLSAIDAQLDALSAQAANAVPARTGGSGCNGVLPARDKSLYRPGAGRGQLIHGGSPAGALTY